MSYSITNYSKQQAKKLNVTIKPSTNKKKKIDVFKQVKNKSGEKSMKKIASIGAIGYMDYPNYIKKDGKIKANIRRKAYKARHQKFRNIVGTNSYYADKILW